MELRRWLLAAGTGATVFLVAATVGPDVVGDALPARQVEIAALVAGALTATVAFHVVDAESGRPAQSVVAAGAAFAFAFLALSALALVVPPLRGTVTGTPTLAGSGVVAVLGALLGWLRYPVVSED